MEESNYREQIHLQLPPWMIRDLCLVPPFVRIISVLFHDTAELDSRLPFTTAVFRFQRPARPTVNHLAGADLGWTSLGSPMTTCRGSSARVSTSCHLYRRHFYSPAFAFKYTRRLSSANPLHSFPRSEGEIFRWPAETRRTTPPASSSSSTCRRANGTGGCG